MFIRSKPMKYMRMDFERKNILSHNTKLWPILKPIN
jgi:hypothetical protein